eukprot:COSAG05_NODE_2020_length_3685_cov_65.556051_2_plen_45_part_00
MGISLIIHGRVFQHRPASGPLQGCRCIEMQQIAKDTLWDFEPEP